MFTPEQTEFIKELINQAISQERIRIANSVSKVRGAWDVSGYGDPTTIDIEETIHRISEAILHAE